MRKILLIEDDELTRKSIMINLEKSGYPVIQSRNCEHAYETLDSNDDINLIIADIMLPNSDGRQLVRTLRCNSKFKDMPVIMISAMADVKDVLDVLMTGMTWFLKKPVANEELNDLLTRIFEITDIRRQNQCNNR